MPSPSSLRDATSPKGRGNCCLLYTSEGVVPAAAGMAPEDGSGLIDAVEQAARAACDDSLIDPEPAVFDLAAQVQLHVRAPHQLLDVLLAFVEDVLEAVSYTHLDVYKRQV